MSDLDFKQALADAGVPTTEVKLKAAWEAEVAAQGAKLSNTSSWSPFWRVVTALVTKPVLWMLDFIAGTVLPNFFVKTAVDAWLDLLAWQVNVERKAATKASGQLLFTRSAVAGTLEIPAGTRVQSIAINGNVYVMVTTAVGLFLDGQAQTLVPAEASAAGTGYNLAPGYFSILPEPIPGVVQVVNAEGWLLQPGADTEGNNDLRLRVRNQFSAVNQWHTDSVYRAMIAAFPGVQADGVYFEHGAPRGPGTANAYVLFENDAPADTYLGQINAHVREQGNHGHGDDLLVMQMPETQHLVRVTVWPTAAVGSEGWTKLKADLALFIRAAFRENSDYKPTLTYPQSQFSFSQLTTELHEQFAGIRSLDFDNADIVSQMTIPRLTGVEVLLGD
ncbi:baseplate J/gp47 family protein [Pseudomonas putida]|uniref:baseplate J/gp47 family protein n=1 Tax=Pseudomonas putida group TaxID=136845 RepID=UPI0018AAE63E|nr:MULTISPECIES: baseplate J/gp47 family protein [Pseudomonas putida group]MBF8766675.1 baseplate J/gp47 family protein [Pseudomonas putida]MEC4022530.1 baseplate J/gp47 family protein [Pseudomonas fulva]